jgi:hypothetical protein
VGGQIYAEYCSIKDNIGLVKYHSSSVNKSPSKYLLFIALSSAFNFGKHEASDALRGSLVHA